MSQKIRSGSLSAILASASKPSSARITWQPDCFRKISALRRIVLLSSITITFNPVSPATPLISYLHHLEVFLACAALGAGPVDRDVLPARAGCDPLVGQAVLLFVHPSADQAHPRAIPCARRVAQRRFPQAGPGTAPAGPVPALVGVGTL